MTLLVKTEYEHRPFLDTARWVSAFIVAIGHALSLVNNGTEGASILVKISDMRGPAVTVFFVLSGYLVGGKVARDFSKFRWGRYASARFARIYIVLLPAILLTVSIDGAAYFSDPTNPIFAGVWQGGALGSEPIASRYTLFNWLGTLLSMEPLFGRPLGSAGSLWSLGYEWMFYFSFPVIYGLGFYFKGRLGGLISALLSIVAVFFLSRIGAAFWMVWLMGAFACSAEALMCRIPGRGLIKGGCFVALIAYLCLGEEFNHQYMLPLAGIAGFGFLVTGPQWEGRLTWRLDQFMANFSYSLYAVHLQVMTGICAVLLRFGILPEVGISNPAFVLLLASVLIAVSGMVAFLFGELFESRTADFTAWLRDPKPFAWRHSTAPRRSL